MWQPINITRRNACRSATEMRHNSFALQQPRDPQPISSRAMKKARSHSVVIDVVTICDNAQLAKVEVSIARLQRIKSPGDAFHPKRDCCISLRTFQQITEIV